MYSAEAPALLYCIANNLREHMANSDYDKSRVDDVKKMLGNWLPSDGTEKLLVCPNSRCAGALWVTCSVVQFEVQEEAAAETSWELQCAKRRLAFEKRILPALQGMPIEELTKIYKESVKLLSREGEYSHRVSIARVIGDCLACGLKATLLSRSAVCSGK